ncbi:MAG: RnfABCDGE type electron transport complex subunit D [Phycisphaeraceae bacterium]
MSKFAHSSARATTPPAGPPWLPAAHDRLWVDRRWLIVTFALTAAALSFFGWRALLNIAIAGGAATIVHALIAWGVRAALPQRRLDSTWHALALGALLGLCLPPLAAPWFVAIAGAALGAIAHVVGRAHPLRVHPVALVMSATLLLAGAAPFLEHGLLPETAPILRPNRLIVGNLHDAPTAPDWPTTLDPWWHTAAGAGEGDTVLRPVPARTFLVEAPRYLTEPATFSEAVRSRRLPSLAAVVLGAAPGAVGATSVGLLLVMGLWLMYERLARPGTALAAVFGAAVAVCAMPVMIGETWTWALGELVVMSAPMAVLFIAHVLLASLLPMIVLVLAPEGQPMSAAGRLVYGLLIGAGAVAAMWWFERPEGAYLALGMAGLLARPLDALRREQFKSASSTD